LLAGALHDLTFLKHLNLSSNQFGDPTGRALAGELKKLTSLKYLDLSDNNNFTNGVKKKIGESTQRTLCYLKI
jgi:Leucine-rich repeat (LRR) protein